MNLLDIKLASMWKIESDCVEDDYYALSNLISSDESKRKIGFMAYSVSKPPISIIFEFKHKFELKMIKILSSLSPTLRSTKFQIHIETQEKDRKFFRKIEEISLSDDHQGFILKTSDIDDEQSNLKVVTIHPRFCRNLKEIQKVRIDIVDTWMKRAPVIRKIEIWGEPNDNSKEEIERLLRQNCDIKTEEKADKSPQITLDYDFKIPEDFLDAITNELLTMPYILPSGNIVDETTLEKHKRNEEIYGRAPSDPFTGVYFTSDSFPKFDASLKMRLDQFKLKYSHEIEVKKSGRTVGRREIECQPSTSSSVTHASKKIKLSKESSLDDLIQSFYKNKQVSSYTTPKSSQVDKSKSCNECEKEENLYKITSCDHLYCKDCLLKLNLVCKACNQKFENKNVVKFHP